jgi:hypothetical protein
MKIEIDDSVASELSYMLDLLRSDSHPVDFRDVEHLFGYILSCVADDSRRPGSWERGMLQSMGLVADCDAHYLYRARYGRPEVEQ